MRLRAELKKILGQGVTRRSALDEPWDNIVLDIGPEITYENAVQGCCRGSSIDVINSTA